jgi:alkyl hydroperoxide reductase subunit F
MRVGLDEAVTIEHEGQTVYFCSEGCRDLFLQEHEGVHPQRRHELIVIGGGPAGLTAAVYAATLRIDAFVFTADLGGQAVDSTKIANYMGYDFITGPELTQKFRNQLVRSHYVRHVIAEVEQISAEEGGYVVCAAGQDPHHAKSVIVATGMTRRRLEVPGEETFQRKGILYGNIQDLSFMMGRSAAVVGGGNTAIQIAADLVTVARDVHIVSDLPLSVTADAGELERLTARPNVHLHEGFKVREFTGEESLTGMTIHALGSEENRVVPISGAFIAVGLRPNSALVAGLADLNDRGEIVIGPDCATSREGLFAAGDVTDAYGKRIIIAAGEGAKAALAARQYLLSLRRKSVSHTR